MSDAAFRLAIIIIVGVVLTAFGVLMALLIGNYHRAVAERRRAWEEFNAHRQSIRADQAETSRRVRDYYRRTDRGGRP